VERLLQWEGPELETELEVEGVAYTDFEVEGKSKLFLSVWWFFGPLTS
jgi:hypothetical protein